MSFSASKVSGVRSGVGPLRGPVLIMAGGTGGHVFPGLAVANALQSRAVDVVWLGTHRGLEAELVPAQGIDIEWISISGLRRSGLTAWFVAPLRLLVACVQALAVMRRRKPTVVLGMGGFVSGPGGIAAWLSRRPLLIHEQNAVPGTTNRWLARLARHVFEAFPDSFEKRVDAECVGNPVRASLESVAPPQQRFAARNNAGVRPRLLVLGGSRGARALNTLVPAALARLPASLQPEVWHQSGREYEATCEAYQHAGVEARLTRFIDDVADAYAWADLVVARAGALTVSELATVGLGAILVPYPYAVDDHQSRNASRLAAAGAAIVADQKLLDAEAFAAHLANLLADRSELERMAVAARGMSQPGSAVRVAAACIAQARAVI